jgi:serine protease Do
VLFNQPVWADLLPDFVLIAKENADAVVAISVSLKQMAAPRAVEAWMSENNLLGSGFVISEDGYILTNYHVIWDAEQIRVRFKDRRELAATLIGADEATDVALLKVNDTGLTKVKIGSVATLEVGEWVMAIGSPFGFEQTVTKGIVSAKNRILSQGAYIPFIQTDASINQGNSGGPLFNGRGRVVGINAMIYIKTGGSEGLSFAIPIDLAMNVTAQIKTKGKVSRGWLGIKTQEVSLELAQSFAMSRAYGALISAVSSGSPAQKAGLKVGDIVVTFDGQTVESSAELPSKVGRVLTDEMINLEIIRQGEKKTFQVKVLPSPRS